MTSELKFCAPLLNFHCITTRPRPLRVCLVAEGEIAFMGKTSDALDHFRDAGYACPANFNPADHYIFTLAIRPGNEEKCRKKCEVSSGRSAR